MLSERNLFKEDRGKLKMKGWRKIYHANIKQKKGGVAKIKSNKVGFRANKIIRQTERHIIQ